jgi:predicted metal-binding protein
VIRFGGLEPEDTSALLAAATTYAQSTDGILSPNTLPERLRRKLTGCVTLGVPELARR